MQKQSWKFIAHIPGIDGRPGWLEYFVVRETSAVPALAALIKARPDLAKVRCESKGHADQDFLDWLQPDQDVFSIMALS
jgi:hypothetical protein